MGTKWSVNHQPGRRYRLHGRNPGPRIRAQHRQFLRLPEFETMEPRVLLSVVTWAVDSSGFWDVAANWVDDQGKSRVPGAGDDVVVDRPTTDITVTYRSGTTSIHVLTSRESFVISGGSLSIDASAEFDNPSSLTGGTL